MGMRAYLKKVSSDELNKLLKDPINLANILFEEDSDTYHLDKSWHAIHYLLNGSVWGFSSVAGSIFFGGDVISGGDMGYGPARYFSPSQVKEISLELEKKDSKLLFANYSAMLKLGDKIYPGFQNNDEDKEYIEKFFQGLKAFCKEASNEEMCLISYMT